MFTPGAIQMKSRAETIAGETSPALSLGVTFSLTAKMPLRKLGKEAGASAAPHVEIRLRSCESAEIREIIVQRIPRPQHSLAVLGDIPGKTYSGAEIVLINVVEWLLREADKSVRIGLWTIRKEI